MRSNYLNLLNRQKIYHPSQNTFKRTRVDSENLSYDLSSYAYHIKERCFDSITIDDFTYTLDTESNYYKKQYNVKDPNTEYVYLNCCYAQVIEKFCNEHLRLKIIEDRFFIDNKPRFYMCKNGDEDYIKTCKANMISSIEKFLVESLRHIICDDLTEADITLMELKNEIDILKASKEKIEEQILDIYEGPYGRVYFESLEHFNELKNNNL